VSASVSALVRNNTREQLVARGEALGIPNVATIGNMRSIAQAIVSVEAMRPDLQLDGEPVEPQPSSVEAPEA
jgi:hypothetical protein